MMKILNVKGFSNKKYQENYKNILWTENKSWNDHEFKRGYNDFVVYFIEVLNRAVTNSSSRWFKVTLDYAVVSPVPKAPV